MSGTAVRWASEPLCRYDVGYRTNLLDAFRSFADASNLPSAHPQNNVFTDKVHGVTSPAYYQIRVYPP